MGIRHGLIVATCFGQFLVACRKDTDRVPGEPEAAPWPERAAAYEAELERHREAGWLVVRNADGTYHDQGDSLTWTGEAMGVSCAQAGETLSALEHMQDTYGGYYVRVEPLPSEYIEKHNVVSRDGWIGVAYGMTRAWGKCPDLRARISASWGRARTAVDGATLLHPNAWQAVITPWFRFFMNVMTDFFAGAPSRVSDAEKTAFELASEATVHSVVNGKDSCYPLHLAFNQVLALAAVGSPISLDAKRDLCLATESTGLVNWRWYCQDSSGAVASWLEQYQPNQIVYRHQRCSWETEDFPQGDTVGSLDWLTLRDLYVNGGG